MGSVSVSSRRYRVRVAIPYAEVVDDTTTDFVIAVGDADEESRLVAAPIVQGQEVHPIRGRSDMIPFVVEGLDTESSDIGTLTADLSDNQRWRAIGRLCDVQYQDLDPGGTPEGDWQTYGTGRCTQLDELDGPGKLRLEISDESWKIRTGRIFETADTTQLWPSGLRTYWRGYAAAPTAVSTPLDTDGNTFFVLLSGILFNDDAGSVDRAGVLISDRLLQWVRADVLPEPERVTVAAVATGAATRGNFRHLRVNIGGFDYEVITFANPPTGPILQSLENENIVEDDGLGTVRVWAWCYRGANPAPSGNQAAFLWAPTGATSTELPLHVGVADADHYWGTALGFIHVADMTRRVFDALGLVYDPDNLDEFEADKSFPALSPRVTEIPDNPMEWMQRHIWAFCGLTTGRDVFGRLKLIDLRPVREVPDYTTVLDASNARQHRWRLVGAEMVNAVNYLTLRLTRPAVLSPTLRDFVLKGGPDDERPDSNTTLDNFFVTEEPTAIEDGDTIADSGRRLHTFDARAAAEVGYNDTGLFGSLLGRFQVQQRIIASGAGALFETYKAFMSPGVLNTYQDGLLRGHVEIHGDIADGLEEGDLLWVDLDSLKIPSPGRLGGALPASVGPQNPGAGQGELDAPPTITSAVLQSDNSIIVTVAGVGVGVTAVIEYATTNDPSDPPPSDSNLWLVGGTRTSNGSVTIPSQPTESFVWIRVSGQEGGVRVSTYATPEVVEIPAVPTITAAALTHIGSGVFVVTWTANSVAGGVMIQWAEHEPADAPDTYEYAEMSEDTGSFEVPETVTVGNFLTVIITPFTSFGGGDVGSPAGAEVVLSEPREESIDDLLDHALGSHTDTDFETPQDGDVVQWDETLGKYIVGPVQAEAAAHTHTFLELTDTPASYAGEALKLVRVNAAQTALEFFTSSSATALNDLTDVVLDSPEGQDVLTFIDSDDIWVNMPAAVYIGADHFPQVLWGGRLAYRLDHGTLYQYDGNLGLWLSEPREMTLIGSQISASAIAATTAFYNRNPGAGRYDIRLDTLTIANDNLAATPASNYFTYQILKTDGATETNIGPVPTASGQNDTQNTWVSRLITINETIPSSVEAFRFLATESGTASTLMVAGITYRRIG